ncbi:MAG: EAL domain-containing protein [bacterium]|nr:EAL domain-containing protein [bacterium]
MLRGDQMRYVLNALPDPVLVVDADLVVQTCNWATVDLGGFEVDQLRGRPLAELFSDPALIRENFEGVLNGALRLIDAALITRGGREIPVSLCPSQLHEHEGRSLGILVVVRPVGELEASRRELREIRERHALVVEGSRDGLWDWDLRSGVVELSSRLKAMLGYRDHEVPDHESWMELIHPEERDHVERQIDNLIHGRSAEVATEHRMLHNDGDYRWVLTRALALCDTTGKAYRVGGSQTDITASKENAERLEHRALHDQLTGLPNRTLFMDRLDHVLKYTQRREDHLFAVLHIDVDRFKLVNDSLGRLAGDRLLEEVGKRLQDTMRNTDSVGRLGGDEFVILLEEIKDITDAIRVVNRVDRELAAPFEIEGQEFFITMSTGIVLSETGYERAEDVLRDAEIAMYRAKTTGKARYEVFDKDMLQRMTHRLSLETDLRRALERDELRVFYQPIIELEHGTLIGFEALVRWVHPQRGFIAPPEFIGLAEETGLIIALDRWVLREACEQTFDWQHRYPAHPPLIISANLSSKQFARSDLISFVKELLGETGLAPQSLKLELTESVLMENVQAAAASLRELRTLGIQVKIDDFGTGYSSLSYLHRLPIDMLKIDRSFVSHMDNGDVNSEIVQTILLLARALNIKVVAEGVETVEQLERLRELKCHYGQGYLFAKPVDKNAAEELIERARSGQLVPGAKVPATS